MSDINTQSFSMQSSGLPNQNSDDKQSLEEAKIIWSKFLSLLSDSIKEGEIKTWFSVITPVSFSDGILTILVPSSDYYSIIERRYNKQITNVIDSGLLGDNGKLKYEVFQPGLFNNNEDEHVNKQLENSSISADATNTETSGNFSISNKNNGFSSFSEYESSYENSNLYGRNTFDTLVEGESNELAVAAAYAVSNNPGKSYNPFYVYGGVGVGKTHLIQAIGNEILKKYTNKRVYYTTAPDFTTEFTTNMARSKIDFSSGRTGIKKLDSFYKSLDVLIIDDIQNFAGKPSTQDFVYQIFNYLHNNNKHLIFSSDKPINQIKDIEERLISRFQWGFTVDIQPPNWEMRVAIIRKKLELAETEAPEDVIHYIATNVKNSIRTIEGCITGIIAETALIYNGEITLEIAEKVVNRVVGNVNKTRNVSIENIIKYVSEYFNVSENNIRSKKRTKDVVFARQVAMYLSKEMTNFTFESIGLNFGGKDHATVLYAHNLIKELFKKDKKLLQQVNEIKDKIISSK